MADIAFPHHRAQRVVWPIFIGIFGWTTHSDYPANTHDHAAWIIGQRGPLGIKEDQRLLRLDSVEEGIEHNQLV
jgi:hypothetical protein